MIHVQDLVKTFGEVKAVDHISFDVPEGEIFAFLGPNGAGKTTTIQMLTTLRRADERHDGAGRHRSRVSIPTTCAGASASCSRTPAWTVN